MKALFKIVEEDTCDDPSSFAKVYRCMAVHKVDKSKGVFAACRIDPWRWRKKGFRRKTKRKMIRRLKNHYRYKL